MEEEKQQQCYVFEQRINELVGELEQERSRHRIAIQELEGMQEATLNELVERDNEIQKLKHKLNELEEEKAEAVQQQQTEHLRIEAKKVRQCDILQQELEEEKSRHMFDLHELEGMQEAMLKELRERDNEI